MGKILKIYFDRKLISDGSPHVAMLYPFLGKSVQEDVRDTCSGRFQHYEKTGREYFTLTSLADADIAVLPISWEYAIADEERKRRAEQYINSVFRAGKLTVIFFHSDSDEPIDLPGVLVFRTSLYRSLKKPNEFALPAWSEDIVEKYLDGQLIIRRKMWRPVVGFCGLALPPRVNWKSKVKIFLKFLLYNKKDGRKEGRWAVRRGEILSKISRNWFISGNIIMRDDFFVGAHKENGTVDFQRKNEARKEFVANMVGCDYAFCMRGKGNYSYRLYEAMCCGRIPVFIDTDCVLPYMNEIDWHNLCVWIDYRERHLINRRILKFHLSLSKEEFEEKQKECRNIWEKYLSPQGFFANFYKHLDVSI